MNGFEEQLDAAQTTSLRNAEAELGLLGDLLADNRLVEDAADRCRPADFSVPIYGKVFARILELARPGVSIDAVTLAPYLEAEEDWQRVFRVLSAAHLNAGPPSRTRTYIDQVAMLSNRRRMVAGLQDVIVSARDMTVPREDLIANADEAVAELAETVVTAQAPVGRYAQSVIDSFGRPIVGVRCGLIPSLDDVLGVLRPSNLVVVGGRPGMGKTSLVTSYAIGAATNGHPTLIYSLEMSADELTRRMLADMTYTTNGGVPYEHIRDGTVRRHQMPEVLKAMERFDAIPLEINETSGLTLKRFERQTRSHKRSLAANGQKLELVIVDYLQLMSHSRKGMSLYEHATEVSAGLKQFAKAENLAVMAVAQLSREVERRPDKRPMQSDLRDSGQIEQDADVILFLYREEEYLRRSEPQDQFGAKYETWRTDMEAVRNKIEFLVPKRRSGPTGKALGWFFGANSAVRGSDFYSNPETR